MPSKTRSTRFQHYRPTGTTLRPRVRPVAPVKPVVRRKPARRRLQPVTPPVATPPVAAAPAPASPAVDHDVVMPLMLPVSHAPSLWLMGPDSPGPPAAEEAVPLFSAAVELNVEFPGLLSRSPDRVLNLLMPDVQAAASPAAPEPVLVPGSDRDSRRIDEVETMTVRLGDNALETEQRVNQLETKLATAMDRLKKTEKNLFRFATASRALSHLIRRLASTVANLEKASRTVPAIAEALNAMPDIEDIPDDVFACLSE